jgi:hypothetical protein
MAGYIGSKGSGIISGIGASIAELNLNDKASANGTTEANKVLTADGNKDVTAIRNLTATGDATVGGAITATGTVTRALTRGSIDVGNSSGVSSALAKGAAGTVLTSDGTDLSFVAASGGGEQTFTATGAVSNGDIVGLNFDGTISVMSQKVGSITDASSAAIASTNSQDVAYDSANNKILYVYTLGTGIAQGVVGTVSGNSISFGTPVNVVSTGAATPKVCFDSNAGKFAVVFRDNTATGMGAVVATISGTSVSFGSKVTVDSEYSSSGVGKLVFDPDQNVIIYMRMGTSNHGRISAGSISGTSISWGTTVEYTTDVIANVGRSFDMTYDTSANKAIIIYKRYINTTSGDIYYRTVTTSGTSITLGSQATFFASTYLYALPRCCYDSAANKTFFAYSEGTNYQTVVGTLSGDTFSFGTTKSNISGAGYGSSYFREYDYNPDKSEIIESSLYLYGSAQTANYKIVGTDNYATAEINLYSDLGTTNSSFLGSCYDTGSDKMVIAFFDDVDSDKAKALVFDPAIPTNWVGLAGEAISNGASGKVTVIGGINTGQSGLVAGVSYKVTSASSSLSESAGTTVGTALSASSIYLTKAAI